MHRSESPDGAAPRDMLPETDTARPLSGIRVLDLTSLAMGPLATQLLGDHGADVIKVEPLEGDGFRHILPQRHPGMGHAYLQFNRNKRSLAVDLKTEEGSAVVRELVGRSDVFVSNIRPDALARLGLSYDQLKEGHAGLIYCSAHGFSERGPYAGRPAADDVIQAMSGVVDLQRRATGQPAFVAGVIADKAVGLMLANAVLAALLHRHRHGTGQTIEVPMFECMSAFTAAEHLGGAAFSPPVGDTGYTRLMARDRRPYPTLDGALSVLPYTTGQWLRLLRIIGRDDLADDPAMRDPLHRSRHIAALYEAIAQAMPSRTTQDWIDLLADADIMYGPVNRIEDLLTDPHLDALGLFPVVEHPSEGPVRTIGFPVTYSASPNTMTRFPPRIGQHTHEILRELGRSDADIRTLVARRVVAIDGRSG